MRRNSSSLSATDVQIARRVREVREKLRLTREEFASQLAIKTDRIASYEDARVAIRFDIALRLCRQFLVSEKWLATGRENAGNDELIFLHKGTRNCMSLELEPETRAIPPDTLFSAAYDSILGKLFEKIAAGHPFYPRVFVTLADKDSLVTNALTAITEDCIRDLPSELKVEYASAVVRAAVILNWEMSRVGLNGSRFVEAIRQATHRCQVEAIEQSSHFGLTDSSSSARSSGEMKSKPQWPELKKKLQAAVELPGARSALVKFLNVDPTQISQWLSESKSAREPGGEYALQMQAWLNDPKRPK
ncbi:MAG: XRE family transcriptional regulator [Verrucomicrobia bacterium]|nr:MAG: XRE family transcriptional regulator [Verrucomicrobiota bacterium]